MKKLYVMACITLLGLSLTALAEAKNRKLDIAQPFEATVLTDGLDAPWEMLWGPDNMLWVTERHGKRITRVDPKTGKKSIAVVIKDAHVGPQHEGILGMAFGAGMADQGQVYVAYTYKNERGEFERVLRLDWDGKTGTLSNPYTVIEGIPAGDDHQGGRLIFGPDGKLYLTKGELGHNQFGNYCKPIEAQRLPTEAEVRARNYAGYLGKILRLNPDGSIPADNPRLNGVVSHVYTYGHRNPQGLVFAGNVLYSSEQGPSTDDEINIIVPGGNYGWPHVAGYQDDNSYHYANWSAAPDCARLKYDANQTPPSVPVQLESEWEAPANFQPPAKTFFTVPPHYNFNDPQCAGDNAYMCWPTISPGSIAYYPAGGPIPGWGNSLLVTSMKHGAIYRLPLSSDQKQVQGFTEVLFRTNNRYRVARLSPDGKTLYIATDNSGAMLGTGGITTNLANPGSILKIEYKGK